nr:four-helix bundle copper-binding protein [Niastella soli]
MQLVNLLSNCIAECNHCASACLEEADVKDLTKCIKLDLDCADICNLLMGFLARGSQHAEHVMGECAEICQKCAAECEKHAAMEHCRTCAEACRRCAEACMQMAHT